MISYELYCLYNYIIKRFRNVRPMIGYISKKNVDNKMLRGIEVGVSVGVNALSILNNLPVERLYLVDNYRDDPKHLLFVFKKLCPFLNNIKFLHMDSLFAVKLMKDNYFDFVYIDGGHSYEDVKDDIVAWYPKVKSGGVIGGHDFVWGHVGLCKAVVEFAFNNDLEVCAYGCDWWIDKPGVNEK